jgi:hypothetical protein
MSDGELEVGLNARPDLLKLVVHGSMRPLLSRKKSIATTTKGAQADPAQRL